MSTATVKDAIRTIPDYPKAGIQFRDVTSLMQNKVAFKQAIALLAEHYSQYEFDVIAGTEARGFIFGAPLAVALGVGFVPVRKPNKLPRQVISQGYELEYGSDTLEMHDDAISSGQRVLMIDDLLATGGTMLATAQLIQRLGGEDKLSAAGVKSFSICQFAGE